MFSGTKYRRDIQVLRGLAVLAVILFHADESYFPLGYLGVDIFFVISGFVVTPLILRIFTDPSRGGVLSNLRYFYKRRFYRLAPALAATLTLSAVTIFLLGPIADHQRFSRQGIATLLLVGNVGAYRYAGDYFSPHPNPLVHTWSLSVEEQIYIFLPLFLIAVLHNRRRLKKNTVVVLGCISAISFFFFLFPTILQPILSHAGILSASQFSFYSPIDRIWQFTLGGLTFVLLNRYQSHKWIISKSTNLFIVIAVVVVLFGPVHMSLKVSSILASLIAVTVIVFDALEVLPEMVISKLVWIGDRSYSIYLVHGPIVYVAKYSPVTQIGNSENRILQLTIAVVGSILLGALSFSKIENRFRDKGQSNFTSIKSISTTVALTLVLPALIFVSMDKGQEVQYWGLDRNIPRPIVDWDLDPKCNRMTERQRPCLYKISDSTKTILLIGDSHAAHISQAVVDAAKDESWNAAVWTQAACHVQFQRSIRDEVSDQCLTQNQEILKWVERNKPNAIIVSQYVYSYSSQSDLRNALFTLKSFVPNILLIENNPIFPDANEFMVSLPLVMSPYKPPKEFPQSKMITKDRKASNELANWAKENAISTMNFDSIFCRKELCNRFLDNQWLYYDNNHYSAAGAGLLIPKLRAFLQRV